MSILRRSTTRSTSTTFVTDRPELLSVPPAFHLRLAYFISVWSFKFFFGVGLGASRIFRRRSTKPLRPEVKTYPVRPDLRNRIFRPQSSSEQRLPLYIDVHGGGWTVADPETDDEFCSFLAQTFNIVVVSINYHKAPSYKFPCAVRDVADISQAVIHDNTLNIDRTKVVLGGFSAGGNLAFAASQTKGLKGQLSGLVGLYPALDLTESLEEKLSHRARNSPSDLLKSSAGFLTWAYVPPGVDRRDPLLSPRWANPSDLPSHIYLVGAEHDMLCYEASQMAEELTKFCGTDSERKCIRGLNIEDGWQQKGIRWECARGMQHAFTHVTQRGAKERERLKYCEELYLRIGNWLQSEVWEKPRPTLQTTDSTDTLASANS